MRDQIRGCFSCHWGPLILCHRDKGGGWHKKPWGCGTPTFLEVFCFLWFVPTNRIP